MTNQELNAILINVIKERETIYEFLCSQNENDISKSLFNIPTALLKKRLTEFLKTVTIPNIITHYDFDFEGDIITLNVVVTPKKLLGKIDATFKFKINSLSLTNGILKADLSFTEHVNNKDIKSLMLNSITKFKGLIEIAIEHINLPPYISIDISQKKLQLTARHDKLSSLSNVNLKFVELKNEHFFFTYSINDSVCESAAAPALLSKPVSGGFLRDMLNNSDRF